jgi:predicted  nucleic acid-binding Zn-ribbon protein
MLVKKNDEYQALTHEIEQTEARIGEVEESEIKILYDLDTEKEKSKAAEKTILADIAAENAQLSRLAEREKQAQDELSGAIAEVDKARTTVPEALLPRYDRLAKSAGLPVVVALHDSKCGGCHLKVSNGVETEARKGTEIVTCDNCGRILYFAP